MKILYVTTISNTLNAFLIPHIQMLLDKGHEVSIACSIQQPLNTFFKDKDIPIYIIPFDRSPLSKNNRVAYNEFKSLIKNEDFDIIHTHTPVASMIVRMACKKSKSRVFYTAHGFHFFHGAPIVNWLVYYPIEKFLARYTDTLITINDEDYHRAKKKLHAKNIYHVHGVGLSTQNFNVSLKTDLSQFKNSDDDLVFLSIGELNSNKNHEQVINELWKIRDKKFIYLICGIGEKADYLNKLIQSKSLENKIFLLGYRKDIPNIIAASDVYIHPSKREGLPVSVMEAMYAKLPICGSNIRGIRDLVVHNKNGFLVDLDDMSNSFSYYLKILIENKKIRNEMGNESSKMIVPFIEENVIEELKKIYLDFGSEI
ncbi:glycosyltransferase family 4 protein [Enterococcus sp. MJM12]|uniref:Glycosyltransferase family 4 protein n=1 Tax=Candidatus Enterococcus myersii TaxID=2815322 RepID=A0ABS3H3Z4_9ENTE|nr:glycosyltransferase family 4 protein [Enterococcus sp. MJM12]MBO0448183.1 glycosyltransferase family 4 protein [Enterococcus sp. MJM12]